MLKRLCHSPWGYLSYAYMPFGHFVSLFGNMQSESVSLRGHDAASPCGTQEF